ncbi:uncharacterized protein LOC109706186 [Ananas comosus]|uniref:Uncharacterized protein LOC109706186 n=2 Tax=Ananas comosus TaxID=4615 RepID=A0A6P5EGX5_ANACO|nr:uncharacterized protein LOC109706186 [Ananas comosus]
MGQWQKKLLAFSALPCYPKCLNGSLATPCSPPPQRFEGLLQSVYPLSALMDDEQSGKRRRVYSFRPNDIPRTGFSFKYISYLLPSLLRIASIGSCRGDEGKEMKKKIVRFEIDMALVLSVGDDFKWSHALKQKIHGYSTLLSTMIRTYPKNMFSFAEKLHRSFPYPSVQRMLVDTGNQIIVNPNAKPIKPHVRRSTALRLHKSSVKKWVMSKEKEDVNECLGLLRSIIPGGEEIMCLSELVTEVESYVSCLQFQVEVLRALVS